MKVFAELGNNLDKGCQLRYYHYCYGNFGFLFSSHGGHHNSHKESSCDVIDEVIMARFFGL